AVARHPAVRWLGAYRPGFRVSSRLWKGNGDETPEVDVFLHRGESVDAVAAALAALSPNVVLVRRDAAPESPRLRYSLGRSVRERFVKAVSALDAVAWMEPVVAPELLNSD